METALVEAVSRFGFHPRGVADAGGTVHQVRAARQITLDIDPLDAHLVGGDPSGALDSGSVVALVASNARVGASLWEHGVYLRAHSLGKPVRQIATALGTDAERRIKHVRPILARFFLGSAAAVAHHPTSALVNQRLTELGPLLTSPEVVRTWAEPCTLFVLGDPVLLDLPLGYAGRGGMPGTQHHLLGDLRAATALVGTPPVEAGVIGRQTPEQAGDRPC
ncbi:hypothetical protein [Nocardia asteroides]|uniref:hypothetical protein n=1 Tax=Nocardia asteroides TaxID=1824 RepID=UPI0034180E24